MALHLTDCDGMAGGGYDWARVTYNDQRSQPVIGLESTPEKVARLRAHMLENMPPERVREVLDNFVPQRPWLALMRRLIRAGVA